jgi:hypothetical protein
VGVPPTADPVSLPPLVHGRVVPVPVKVVRARLYRGIWELLVQWEGQMAADASWSPLADFKQTFPTFQLEDELFQGRGKCCGLLLQAHIWAQEEEGRVHNRHRWLS